MLAIFEILSDIPMYIDALISEFTGSDSTMVTDFFTENFFEVFEMVEQFLKSL